MGVYIRIALRYVAGFLVLKGILPADLAHSLANDPEVVAAIGVGLAVTVEAFYALARRFGWSK